MENFTDVVILAGGIGERLWPASTAESPKQFMDLGDDVSFLQSSLIRALALHIEGKILVITRASLVDLVCRECCKLVEKSEEKIRDKILKDLIVIAEPSARHTCAPLLFASEFLQAADSSFNHLILTLASDHVIKPVEKFCEDCKKAAKAASLGNFVCFAIPPTEAATGYGYIKKGQNLDWDKNIFSIDNFKEKPDLETAKMYLDSGLYFWNSGMFAFTADFFINEVKKCQNDVYSAFENLNQEKIPTLSCREGIKVLEKWAPMERAYEKTPSIAVDNAIAEKTDSAVAVSTTFEWDDVGSWDSFERHCVKDSGVTSLESSNNFVYSDIPVSLCGVDDMIVVIKNGRALIMKKGSSSMMREIVRLSNLNSI